MKALVPFAAILAARLALACGAWRRRRPPPARTGGALQTGPAAHGGMSAQAPLSRRVDLRADAEMIIPFRDEPGADLLAVVGFVWHR
jgi:hypothetical protein